MIDLQLCVHLVCEAACLWLVCGQYYFYVAIIGEYMTDKSAKCRHSKYIWRLMVLWVNTDFLYQLLFYIVFFMSILLFMLIILLLGATN